MKYSLHRTLLVASAGLVMFALALGCVIQADREQVSRRLDVVQTNTSATFETEGKVMVALQGYTDEQDARIRALNSQLAAAHDVLTVQIADVRKAIQEAGARREADLARL